MRIITFSETDSPLGFERQAELRTGHAGDWRLNLNTNEPELLNGETTEAAIVLKPLPAQPATRQR